MSQARVNTSVFAARKGKKISCEGCGKPIAKGTRYHWFKVGFRSRFVHTYHVGCVIRDSARESSKMAGVFSAREDATAALDNTSLTDRDYDAFIDDIRSTLETAADEWRNVAAEYRDAAEAMGDYGAGQSMSDTADSIEYAADELSSWSPDDEEPNIDHEMHGDEDTDEGMCEDCQSEIDDWASDVLAAAADFLTDAESNIEVAF